MPASVQITITLNVVDGIDSEQIWERAQAVADQVSSVVRQAVAADATFTSVDLSTDEPVTFRTATLMPSSDLHLEDPNCYWFDAESNFGDYETFGPYVSAQAADSAKERLRAKGYTDFSSNRTQEEPL